MAKLTDIRLQDLRIAFDLFDKNGDGRISSFELKEVIQQLGQKVTDKEISEMIKSVDKDGNGTVEFDEFVELMRHYASEESTEDDMVNAFRIFDKNGDGFINFQELKEVMHLMGEKLTDQEVKDMIKAADLNDDGLLDFEEFVTIMKQSQQ
mmetsp:Transcript_28148/g.39738  ORF Transcript_28148/g.39738 Transcript_28148/m.39738 type:complete len:151 (-) Transcript_28148:541-993(-)|eukprot:CAMPEP_0168555736 /NCGR_PEP_ID=MMETSP0413-20121227/8499_1 /TAXON_ID=136452 /ORGANISM="Filamoeba nolandi, Strain NC-AS-23-1" /LENGTH=150 /DNA_ID=CAMNT_0008586617 /DNA_START=154 /DNA_END=606 /DNA_ORIENTATION=-